MNYDCANILRWTEAQLKYTYDVSLQEATPQELHEALGEAVMMAISDNWKASKSARLQQRKAYYFSAEYLIGRLVYSNLYNLGILDEMKQLFAAKGVDLSCLEEIEDAALGNGGLGRLAACFLDSAASCDIPLSGYGLRYKFGLFKQSFDEQGSQKENADDWTKYGDPWSYRRYNHTVKVKFPDHTVLAVPYDVPIIGYGTNNINTLRLWQCEAEEELDFSAFNDQDYLRALAQKNKAEDITRVLYPNDSTWEGKRLRIKQQYVLSSASLQDMLRTFKSAHGNDLSRFADYYAVQLNDTHPAMSIPELIRLLMAEGMDFDQSFSIAQRTFSYTNHTVMSEALEKWPLDLLSSVVPEIVDIIRRIDEKLKREHRQETHRIDKPLFEPGGLVVCQGILLALLLGLALRACPIACLLDRLNDLGTGGSPLHTHRIGQEADRAGCDSRHRVYRLFHPGRAGGAAHARNIVLFHMILLLRLYFMSFCRMVTSSSMTSSFPSRMSLATHPSI